MQYVVVPGTTFEFEFVASNLTFAVVKQIAHFFAEQFKLIATMVEIIDNQPHSYTYYIIFHYLTFEITCYHLSC